MYKGEIPFDRDGKSPLSYDGYTDIVWKDNYTFDAKLKMVSMLRGRSSAQFKWVDENKIEYIMFMKDMELLINNAVIVRGHVEGKWTFIKRGQNYGITYLDVQDDEEDGRKRKLNFRNDL